MACEQANALLIVRLTIPEKKKWIKINKLVEEKTIGTHCS